MKYPFTGLTKHQRRIVDAIGSGNSALRYVLVHKNSIEKLLARGIIRRVGERQIGTGWTAVTIPLYEMPTPEHMLWCEWCSKQVD